MTKPFAKLDSNRIKILNVDVVHDVNCQDESGNYSEEIGINFLKKLHKWDFWTGVHNKNGTCDRDGSYVSDGDYFKMDQPYPSWTFSLSTYRWEAPIAEPKSDNLENKYGWNEEAGEWQHKANR